MIVSCRRIDHIKVSDAWTKLEGIAAEEGLVAIGYERKYGASSRVYQFAKVYLFAPSSSVWVSLLIDMDCCGLC